MGFFHRKQPPVSVPPETTEDRVRMKGEAIRALRRAEALKRRSSAVAADLSEESATNHYIERIREAYGLPT